MKHNALYVTATGPLTGKSAIALGTMQMLSRHMRNVAFFRPIINEPQLDDRDPDINLMLEHFKINMEYADTFAYTHAEAREIINQGSRNILLENIIQKFKKILMEHDFVLCVGTDFLGKDPVFEFELNAEIAANLGCPVMLVTSGDNATAEDIRQSLQMTMDSLDPYALDVVATIINRSHLSQTDLDELRAQFGQDGQPALIYAVPNDPTIGRATMGDVKKGLNAEVLFGENRMDTLVGDYLVAAMHVDNFLRYIAKDQLIISPGDRTDILLAAIASRLSSAKPDIAGVLLTGGMRPPEEVCKLIEGWTGAPLPILLTEFHTYRTITALQEVYGLIEPGDMRKINTVLGLYEHHVNGKEIASRLVCKRSGRMTPMMFEFELIERAKSDKMRIVLAEGEEERILRATDILLRREVADITLLGNVDLIRQKASELGLVIAGATLIDPVKSPKFDDYAQTYYELRKAKGITLEHARDVMSDATYFATMMVKKDDADGMVSGSVNTTAHTIRPAFEFIKTKPGYSVVSSVFLMCLKDRVLAFGDCAVNPNPTAQQLAEIAVASAHTAKVFGIEPRVAMLSYSTGTSGKGADVDVVVEATRIAKEMAPDLALEGPLQYDAAIDPTVAKTKMPDSKVAGKATVFIFPDLNTGNNTYKAVQRAAQAVAIGPVLQGLNKPVNDLSRGCTVPDIVNTVAITAVQAAAEKSGSK
ncbi:phosphate acetyltransferase [uncultured Desulfovibrio sp.]|uniref:phosphate acetyltransferase n=1 Tax=uncultured Desulfovibrio sp. TaxID=167968 RepID=UPI0026DBCD48|nr:phosphate acetyltransferase [uncultured Desulfovibrio sp.]